jgi:hypothetical protein
MNDYNIDDILLEVLKMTKFENNVLAHIHLLERRKRKLEKNNPRILTIDERIHSLKRFVDDDDED